MIALVAVYRARPGEADAVAGRMGDMVTASRREDGCLAYWFHRSRDDPAEFLLYEQYVDEDALDAHRQSTHFQEIVLAEVVPLLESRTFGLYDPL